MRPISEAETPVYRLDEVIKTKNEEVYNYTIEFLEKFKLLESNELAHLHRARLQSHESKRLKLDPGPIEKSLTGQSTGALEQDISFLTTQIEIVSKQKESFQQELRRLASMPFQEELFRKHYTAAHQIEKVDLLAWFSKFEIDLKTSVDNGATEERKQTHQKNLNLLEGLLQKNPDLNGALHELLGKVSPENQELFKKFVFLCQTLFTRKLINDDIKKKLVECCYLVIPIHDEESLEVEHRLLLLDARKSVYKIMRELVVDKSVYVQIDSISRYAEYFGLMYDIIQNKLNNLVRKITHNNDIKNYYGGTIKCCKALLDFFQKFPLMIGIPTIERHHKIIVKVLEIRLGINTRRQEEANCEQKITCLQLGLRSLVALLHAKQGDFERSILSIKRETERDELKALLIVKDFMAGHLSLAYYADGKNWKNHPEELQPVEAPDFGEVADMHVVFSKVHVIKGQAVAKGDKLVTLEYAGSAVVELSPDTGKVDNIHIKPGESASPRQLMITIKKNVKTVAGMKEEFKRSIFILMCLCLRRKDQDQRRVQEARKICDQHKQARLAQICGQQKLVQELELAQLAEIACQLAPLPSIDGTLPPFSPLIIAVKQHVKKIMQKIGQYFEEQGLHAKGYSLFLEEDEPGSERLFPSPRITTHLADLMKLAARIQKNGSSLIESIQKCSDQISKRKEEIEYFQAHEEYLKSLHNFFRSNSSLRPETSHRVTIPDAILQCQRQLAAANEKLAESQGELSTYDGLVQIYKCYPNPARLFMSGTLPPCGQVPGALDFQYRLGVPTDIAQPHPVLNT